ncbi:hypothetical protein ACTXO9_18115 [Brachybacterium tyrofermentans]|uniref:hypothetical protein n=1 Tax=Brachybacterium tyrofermentans TaxID=47848 RepID=UPI003FD5AC03
MTDEPTDSRRRHHRVWWVGSALLVVAALMIGGLLVWDPGEPKTDPDESTASSEGEETSASTSDSAELTVPETLRISESSIQVRAGSSYVLSFEVTTEKPEGSPGEAMYVGVSLGCTGPEEVSSRSISGTQNLVRGEPTVLSSQVLLVAEETSNRTCRITVDSSYDGVAAEGTTIHVDAKWTARPVEGTALEVPAEDRLPHVFDADDRRPAFRHKVELPPGRESVSVEVLSTLHVTTCTVVNGSREGGEPMCVEAKTDEAGSAFDITLRADLLDADGKLCESRSLLADSTHVDRLTHHQLLSGRLVEQVPDDRCGDTVEFVMAVTNSGPAPLLVHGAGSSFIVVVR